MRWEGPRIAELGSFAKNEVQTAVFAFTNRSPKPLIIDNIRTSCGCTVAEWPGTPVLPQETGKITIEVRASNRGYFEQHIKVYFRGQRQAERLTVKGIAE